MPPKSPGCRLLDTLAELFQCSPAKDPVPVVLRLGVGPEFAPGSNPPPVEHDFMAEGNVGNRREVLINITGEVSGPPVVTVSDAAVLSLVQDGSKFFVDQIGQGSSTVDVVQKLPGTSGQLTGSGLLVINDPADDATVMEIEFGPETPSPAA
jgi:hypothetical protein